MYQKWAETYGVTLHVTLVGAACQYKPLTVDPYTGFRRLRPGHLSRVVNPSMLRAGSEDMRVS